MALFAFDEKTLLDSPVNELMDNSQRQKTASIVNAAILKSYHEERSWNFTTI